MKLKRSVDIKNCISLFFFYITCFMISFFFLENDTYLVPSNISFIFITLLTFVLYDSIWYSNSYFYLKRNRSKINAIKDNPIKIPDIQCYRLDNPFFLFSGWCFSSKNITLYLTTGKTVVFAVREHENIIKILKENKIPECKNGKVKGRISIIIIFVISSLISILLSLRFKKINSNNINFIIILISFVTSFYWLFHFISGYILISKQNKKNN